ncbi:MAG: chromophore lyase CpcT/CpeT [Rhodospirillaceae bacterium]|nr:chromophore lyase CpcT/CpeT [Rhodospirillaceae bacterium]
MWRLVLALTVGTGLAHAATLADHLAADREVLLAWVQGEFGNARQVRAGTNALAVGPVAADAAPDLLYPVFARVDVPALGDHVIYLQWPMGAPDGKLQRQRIWVFADDPARNAVMMKFYTLKDPDRWRDAHRDPAKVRTMTAADVIPYPPACDLPFRRHGDVFLGEIPRGDCTIVSQQSRTTMTINARVVIGARSIWYAESGTRDDGTTVFRVPRAGAYEFDRRASASST